MQVIKSSGETERFSSKKIYYSIRDAGGSKGLAKDAVREIRTKFKKNIPTKEILEFLINFLKREPGVAQRYDLKRAIMSLGPTGFPFEKFFARVLDNYGFKTKVGVKLRGKSVVQEVDVVATKEKKWMVECKYHNQRGIITKLHVAMYTHSRFLDLQKYNFDAPWVATNTRCSHDMIAYSKGVGLRVTSWKYPKEDNLEKMVEKKKLYPITILRLASNSVINKLYDGGFVLAKEIMNFSPEELSRKISVDKTSCKKIIDEAKEVCG